MITPAYAQTMARYNTWQNANLYGVAGRLSDAERNADRGAFFGSISATLNHLLWADHMWLVRFKVKDLPKAKTIAEGLVQYPNWKELSAERVKLDAFIEDWTSRLKPADLEGDLSWYSGASQRDMVTPLCVTVTHFFNHQTHHRGQVHCLLTGLGCKPSLTDLPFAPAIAV